MPPVLVKPEDYIEPRIGAEYQANVPDAAPPRYPAGSGAGAAPRASVLDNIVCLHQRNKPSAEPDTGSGSSVYDILLDEVGSDGIYRPFVTKPVVGTRCSASADGCGSRSNSRS